MQIMPKVRKAELSFLYATRHLVLFYISTKYHQNIPKGIRVTELTRNQFKNKTKGDNSKRKKARTVTLACDVSSRPVLHFYRILSKCSEALSNITKGDNAKSKKGSVVILVRDAFFHPVLRFYQVLSKYSKGYLSYRADTKSIHNHCQI